MFSLSSTNFKSKNIKRYYNKNELNYDITYTIQKYDSIFHLNIKTIQEGYYTRTDDYYFVAISHVKREYDTDEFTGKITVDFVTNHDSSYKSTYCKCFDFKIDVDTVFDFLMSNTIMNSEQ